MSRRRRGIETTDERLRREEKVAKIRSENPGINMKDVGIGQKMLDKFGKERAASLASGIMYALVSKDLGAIAAGDPNAPGVIIYAVTTREDEVEIGLEEDMVDRFEEQWPKIKSMFEPHPS